MNKLWQVAVYEYTRNVFKKSFIWTLVSLPVMIAVSVGIGLVLESRPEPTQAVGVVDQAGVIQLTEIPEAIRTTREAKDSRLIEFVFLSTPEEAQAALERGEIQAYFLLPEGYLLTRDVKVIYHQEPGSQAWQQFRDLLRANALSGQASPVLQRAVLGTEIIVRSIDGQRQVPARSGPTFGLLMPLFIAIAILAMLVIGSGYITSAVADEKENRTMEVLVTTISPLQLIGGKILGITAIALTLLTAWAVMVVLGIFVSRLAGIGWFNDLSADWRSVGATIAIGIPGYVLATALMTAVGSMVTTTQEGQSLSSVFFILHFLPFYISYLFLEDPHSSLAVLLSMLPFTSLMTVAMRNLFTIVPAWQVAISVLVQVGCATGAIWLASRAFRIGMLRYGQRLSFRHILTRG